MPKLRDFGVKFEVDAPKAGGFRLAAAKLLLAIVGQLLRVRGRPYAVEAEPKPETEPTTDGFLYRGTPMKTGRCATCQYPLKPSDADRCPWCVDKATRAAKEQCCAECGTSVAELSTYEFEGRGPLCWDCFDARITARGEETCDRCGLPFTNLDRVTRKDGGSYHEFCSALKFGGGR